MGSVMIVLERKLHFIEQPCRIGIRRGIELACEMEKILDSGEPILPLSEQHKELSRIIDTVHARVVLKIIE